MDLGTHAHLKSQSPQFVFLLYNSWAPLLATASSESYYTPLDNWQHNCSSMQCRLKRHLWDTGALRDMQVACLCPCLSYRSFLEPDANPRAQGALYLLQFHLEWLQSSVFASPRAPWSQRQIFGKCLFVLVARMQGQGKLVNLKPLTNKLLFNNTPL